MSSKHWRSNPSAARRYGGGCRCHTLCLAHRYDENMICQGCKCTWEEQQVEAIMCSNPLTSNFVPVGK